MGKVEEKWYLQTYAGAETEWYCGYLSRREGLWNGTERPRARNWIESISVNKVGRHLRDKVQREGDSGLQVEGSVLWSEERGNSQLQVQ